MCTDANLDLKMTVPTPDEIETAIDSINARSPNDWGDVDDLWWAYAYDPQGKLQGVGTGWTLAEARALAWISVWAEDDEPWPRDWRTVPRRVPEGWYFATDHAPDDWRAPDDWYFATEGKPPRH
jgi:hypothetical protein